MDKVNKKAEVKEKPVILYPINANPPHLGHIEVINMLLGMSSKIFVVIYDKMQVCSPMQAVIILNSIFKQYVDKDKIEIVISNTNFTTTNELPEVLTDLELPFTIATTSKHIYSNMKSKGYPYLLLLKRPFGWRDEFYRIAFVRSILLEQIENSNWTKQTDKLVKEV